MPCTIEDLRTPLVDTRVSMMIRHCEPWEESIDLMDLMSAQFFLFGLLLEYFPLGTVAGHDRDSKLCDTSSWERFNKAIHSV